MPNENDFIKFITSYHDYLVLSFEDLWSQIDIEPDKLEAYSVIGGLLSRQVTLALEMAKASPSVLNGHSAPLFLRAMVDVHITTSWILLDLEERAKKYIMHSLGEEKTLIEHYKKEIENSPDNSNNDINQQMIKMKSDWINSQKAVWSVEVNLGSWTNLSTRKMSQEADCESLYNFAYKPFSSSAHSMWSHIATYNSRDCKNPLHQFHLIPFLWKVPEDIDYLYRSCKYVHRLYKVFVDKFEIEMKYPLPLDWWNKYFEENNSKNSKGEKTEE